jgi:hypothetical protein
MPAVQCQTALQSPDNDCVVVDGYVTIFTDMGDTTERMKAMENAREFIKEGMAAGDFNFKSLGIVRVTFLSSTL